MLQILFLSLAATFVAGQYNYQEVIHKSILFYEAQRAGRLPWNNRVPWRGDSVLGDGSDVGFDLSGGWFDAGDHVKFGFPMASTVSYLAWAMAAFEDGYRAAGEWENALDSIKWPLDYMIAAHVHPVVLYGQVADGYADHAVWTRPEDIEMFRPSWSIWHPDGCGSDLAGETAAAMAAASLVFRNSDPGYADILVSHARDLYDLAYSCRGIYSDTITNAQDFYKSWSGYEDELCWSAAWMYTVTGEDWYRDRAYEFVTPIYGDRVDWDDKKAGCILVLYGATYDGTLRGYVEEFIPKWLPGGSIHYTPKGLAWVDQWGPNRYSANMAMYTLLAAEIGIMTQQGRDFSRQQIHYMLGDTGRSFVVGFGNNPPQRPHHRSSSCPDRPQWCSWDDYNNPGPNHQVLNGALVGGPDMWDNYEDRRDDYIANEVATDYNSGFQGAVAGLLSLQIRGLLEE